ncbi:MAG: homocysteine S-methyltransferase family protein [Chloroflexota bacterium]
MNIQERLNQGNVLLMDGGTGTEMEKRGVPMEEKGWSASSTITQPDTLRQIHEEYIQAGAEIIITNTFATSRHILEACDLADKFEEINSTAARVALEARDNVADSPVWVAGSISTTTFWNEQPPKETAERNFNDQADILAEGGVDFFVLEMMRDIDYTNIALNAAKRTGLPVWVGYSIVITEENQVKLAFTGGGRVILLEDALQALSTDHTPLVSIMHTLTEDIEPSLSILKENWSGAMGIYAHSGNFIMPNWQFIDMITPEAYAAEAKKWVDEGVQVVGGCCGIGPEHVRLLKEVLS